MRMGEYRNEQVRRSIDDMIHSERNRKILKRKLIDGVTYDRLAEEFDMSPQGIRKIVRAGKEKLRWQKDS